MLGAAALGDIGHHFPDNSPEFKNISSRVLLTRTNELIREKGYCLVNIDSTVCLEEPRISPYIPRMKSVISAILSLDSGSISIKATTTEKMGFTGRGEGVAALASVLLKSLA
jgi:2-C-methyl-D-erythritol 2,4-cyclodiphosphate synthase